MKASIQPLGQRTTYLSYTTTIPPVDKNGNPLPPNGTHYYYTVVVYPNHARTTISLGNSPGSPRTILNPVGNRTSYAYASLASAPIHSDT